MAEVQYATNAKANAALTTGIVGAAGAVANAVAEIAGGRGGPARDPEDRPVTRYEMNLIRESMAKDGEIAALKSQLYTDGRIAGVQAEISAQAVWNATQEGILRGQAQQLAELYTMTRLTIPNSNVSPGWGPAFVVPGAPPIPTVQITPPTVSSGGSAAAA